jgi:hypothetical protein
MTTALSPLMEEAVGKAVAHGGGLERRAYGPPEFIAWTYPRAADQADGKRPVWHVEPRTVEALISRGYATVTARNEAGEPVAVSVVAELPPEPEEPADVQA